MYISTNKELTRCASRYVGVYVPALFPTGRKLYLDTLCVEATCTTHAPVSGHAVNLSASSLPIPPSFNTHLIFVSCHPLFHPHIFLRVLFLSSLVSSSCLPEGGGWKRESRGNGTMNFVNYTHHLFFASGGRTNRHPWKFS